MDLQVYLDFLKANGVEQAPEIVRETGDSVPGYTPGTLIVWTNGSGQLRQSLGLIALEAANGNGPLSAAAMAAHFCTGNPFLAVTWKEFTEPKAAPAPVLADPMVGVLFEGDGSVGSLFYVVGSNVHEGGTYQMPGNGPKFICIARGMFDRKWKRIA